MGDATLFTRHMMTQGAGAFYETIKNNRIAARCYDDCFYDFVVAI